MLVHHHHLGYRRVTTNDHGETAWGQRPIETLSASLYSVHMNILLIVILVLLLFGGGGGFYFGGPIIGGGILGLVVLVAVVMFFMGAFRTKT